MSTPHVLLGLLSTGPKHGYELKRSYDQHLPRARPVAFAQVYTTLGRLVRDGYATEAGHDQAGGPERTVYEITASGRAELAGWLDQIDPPAPFVASALLAKVTVALLVDDPARAHAYLAAQRQAHTRRLRELTAAKNDADADFADVIGADYAIAHLDADLRWLATTLERVAILGGTST
ncbi:PadR family transcriptional regulator [Luedemannella helvata]|uniref:PadR family transcriptional regulator n=1 Tax=Luedemannella helvata TaxID=349315 RepID=A0ABN2JXY1_9ACTN